MTAVQVLSIVINCNGCHEPLYTCHQDQVVHVADLVNAVGPAEEHEWMFNAETGDAWCPNCQSQGSQTDGGTP